MRAATTVALLFVVANHVTIKAIEGRVEIAVGCVVGDASLGTGGGARSTYRLTGPEHDIMQGHIPDRGDLL
jgi:hypothetical protein